MLRMWTNNDLPSSCDFQFRGHLIYEFDRHIALQRKERCAQRIALFTDVRIKTRKREGYHATSKWFGESINKRAPKYPYLVEGGRQFLVIPPRLDKSMLESDYLDFGRRRLQPILQLQFRADVTCGHQQSFVSLVPDRAPNAFRAVSLRTPDKTEIFFDLLSDERERLNVLAQ